MEPVTLKQYADSQGISYEAVRKQVTRYSEELSDHIIKLSRKRYLDQYAVEFLTERRRESPIILVNMNQSEENEQLKEQIETLKAQLKKAQNELLKRKDEQLKSQERIIALQDEARKTIEDQVRYRAILEDNKFKEEKLREAKNQIDELSLQLEKKAKQINMLQVKMDDLRKKYEVGANQRKFNKFQKKRDKEQTEEKTRERSFLGFYRKK